VQAVNRVVDSKRIIKKWRAKEEESHKGSLTIKKYITVEKVLIAYIIDYTTYTTMNQTQT
jgi:hypothetical protein